MEAAAAAALIPSGAGVIMGMALAEPPALLEALATRLASGLTGDLRVYYFHSTPHAATTILQPALMTKIRPFCFFLGATERQLMECPGPDGLSPVSFIPCAFSEAPRLLQEQIDADVVIAVASPMDEHGYLTLGTSNDYTHPMAMRAGQLILEVNRHMPRVRGSAIHISKVSAIIENHQPLLASPARTLVPEDLEIARLICAHIEDGSCLQVGIGSLPEAICAQLIDRQDLGIHTELLSSALVTLIRSGAVSNRLKAVGKGRSIFTFATGNREVFDFINDNPGVDSRPVMHVNNPSVIARNSKAVSINAALQIDLTGACNAEHLGGRQYSGSGGQLDFVRGAYASEGGKSFIACHSSAKNGTVSRIVARLSGPVTTPRNDTHWIATEHGCINLKGLSVDQRARSIIGLAAPQYRAGLHDEARAMGLL